MGISQENAYGSANHQPTNNQHYSDSKLVVKTLPRRKNYNQVARPQQQVHRIVQEPVINNQPVKHVPNGYKQHAVQSYQAVEPVHYNQQVFHTPSVKKSEHTYETVTEPAVHHHKVQKEHYHTVTHKPTPAYHQPVTQKPTPAYHHTVTQKPSPAYPKTHVLPVPKQHHSYPSPSPKSIFDHPPITPPPPLQHNQPSETYAKPSPHPRSCPPIDHNVKCSYGESQCWSPGVPDLDCPGSGLCCFNGCINICLPLPALPIPHEPAYGQKTVEIPQYHEPKLPVLPVPKQHHSYPKEQPSPKSIFDHPPITPPPSFIPHQRNKPSKTYEKPSPHPASCPPVDHHNVKCSYKDSQEQCWSDIDCPESGICCFNGCANVCLPVPALPVPRVSEPISNHYETEPVHSYETPETYPQKDPVHLYEPVQKYQGPVLKKQHHEHPPHQTHSHICPIIENNLKCGYEESECWSPGVRDLDCPGSTLCCFNGCVNKCMPQGKQILFLFSTLIQTHNTSSTST